MNSLSQRIVLTGIQRDMGQLKINDLEMQAEILRKSQQYKDAINFHNQVPVEKLDKVPFGEKNKWSEISRWYNYHIYEEYKSNFFKLEKGRTNL